MNFGHHDEFELSGLTEKDIEDRIKERKVFYNHFADISIESIKAYGMNDYV